MKIREIIATLEDFAPLALQADYDNAGLQTGLAEDAEATGVLLCLDVTEDVVDEAVLRGCNLIVSHHPVLFRPVKSITQSNCAGRVVIKAIQNGVAIYSAHTNLDNAYGGVNHRIAEKLRLKEIDWLSPKGTYMRGGITMQSGEGIIAKLPAPLSQREFMDEVKEIFGLCSLRVNNCDKKKISRVALCGGAGASLISKAVEKGADAFLTGELGYHNFFGYDHSMLLMEMGHYESEQYTLDLLRDILSAKSPTLSVCKIRKRTNPVNYF